MIVPITIDTSLLGLGDLKTLRTLVALAGDSASLAQINLRIAQLVCDSIRDEWRKLDDVREPVSVPLAACQANLERKA